MCVSQEATFAKSMNMYPPYTLAQCFSTDGSWNFFPKILKAVLMAQLKKTLSKKIKILPNMDTHFEIFFWKEGGNTCTRLNWQQIGPILFFCHGWGKNRVAERFGLRNTALAYRQTSKNSLIVPSILFDPVRWHDKRDPIAWVGKLLPHLIQISTPRVSTVHSWTLRLIKLILFSLNWAEDFVLFVEVDLVSATTLPKY